MQAYLRKFISGLADIQVFTNRDFSEGVSRIITLFPDIALDVPQIHIYLYSYIIKPLVDAKVMEMKGLNFRLKRKDVIQEEEGDDEDIDFDNSDCLFKFIATILVEDMKKMNKGTLVKSFEFYDRMYDLKEVIAK